MIFNKISKVTLFLLFTIISGFAGFYIGNRLVPPIQPEASAATQNNCQLLLSAKSDPNAVVLHKDGLEDKFIDGIQYRNVTNVTITVNGKTVPFEEALRDELIFPEEIFAYARADARNGFCEETADANHGLTHFTYHYPEFDLRLIYDLFTTPDGKQHLISDLAVFNSGGAIGPYVDFYDEKTGERLDREDWGIALELTSVSQTGLTLFCAQSGGQQIGQLQVTGFSLAHAGTFVPRLNGSSMIPDYDTAIQMEGRTQIVLDWTDSYGPLPSGTYALLLHIRDTFVDTLVHPLMDDFHDRQTYILEFTVP